MRTFLIALLVLVIAFFGYAYSRNPAGCMKVVHDFVDLCKSVSPVRVHVEVVNQPTETPQPTPTPATTESQPIVTPAPFYTPAVSPTPSSQSTPTPTPTLKAEVIELVPTKPWTAPTSFPAQPNWTWSMSNGKVYHNVKITMVQADAVTILHDEGGALVPMSDLTPELQKQLNYDPEAAAEVAALRQKSEMAAAQDRQAKMATVPASGTPHP